MLKDLSNAPLAVGLVTFVPPTFGGDFAASSLLFFSVFFSVFFFFVIAMTQRYRDMAGRISGEQAGGGSVRRAVATKAEGPSRRNDTPRTPLMA